MDLDNDTCISVGAAFAPMNADGKWTCDTKIFDRDAVKNDVVNIFNIEVWDLESYKCKGYDKVSGEFQGWSYTHVDMDSENWDLISEVVQGFDLYQRDQIYLQDGSGLGEISVAGQVEDVSAPATWTLSKDDVTGAIMNPYPIDTTFAEIEKFAQTGDQLYVFSQYFYDFISYKYKGAGEGWAVTGYDENWDPTSYVETDSTKVVLPAGIGGIFTQAKVNKQYIGRTWTVSLQK